MKNWLQKLRCRIKGGHDMDIRLAPLSLEWEFECTRCHLTTRDMHRAAYLLRHV